MKTTEVNESLVGNRCKGIAFGEMVTGTITSVEVDDCAATVYFTYDTPQNWGGELYTAGSNWARLKDEFGSLHHLELIETRRYEIWQADPDTEKGRRVKFSSYEEVGEFSLEVSKDCYKKVYEGETYDSSEVDTLLENLFMKFQGTKPEGYTGHSLSVSDVIVIEGAAYYTDGTGFVKIEF